MTDYRNIFSEVCRTARQAGEFIRAERENFSLDKIEIKGRNDFVSYVDRTAEQIIVKELMPLIPDAGFLTEEATIVQERKNFTWIIDPIDGTTNYVHGLGPYSLSIALTEGGELVVGAVYVASSDECFYAWKGGKAMLNQKPIRAAETRRIEDALFITGFPYGIKEKIKKYSSIMEHLSFNSHGIRRLGSAAADLVYVACGYADAFFETGLKPWDTAAGVFIARTAGATVTGFDGEEDAVFGKSIVATAPGIYDETISLLKQFF